MGAILIRKDRATTVIAHQLPGFQIYLKAQERPGPPGPSTQTKEIGNDTVIILG